MIWPGSSLKGWAINVLFAGNALATHDMEAALFGTSLGMSLQSGASTHGGHEHHLRTINRIRTAWGRSAPRCERAAGLNPYRHHGRLRAQEGPFCARRIDSRRRAVARSHDGHDPSPASDAQTPARRRFRFDAGDHPAFGGNWESFAGAGTHHLCGHQPFFRDEALRSRHLAVDVACHGCGIFLKRIVTQLQRR